ncbi:putative major facilitator, sugar transporter, major facilitator superfamily [Medicago truncatula]|uniref:Putative major facilitator, sugar transporter, major facilitator superfamily n=1 Tax=Medicago truncatula TaxID=3880 RepID=A0A396HZX2_MEDTR|nr:putative major facilitator, sugar transporter, major facilitator superfamily [Medicago truncatula]
MAGGYIAHGSEKEYPGKLTFRVFIACMIAAFGGLIFGYDLGISDTTLFTSSLYLAALVDSLGASTVTRIFGRRLTMLSGGVLFLAGAAMNGFAEKVWMLYVGRMLLGFGIGCANQSVPIYLSEVAPYKYRGALNMMFQLSITIGIFWPIAFKFGVDGNPGELPKWYALLVVIGICVYVMGFTWSWGPLGWLVPSETFPLEVRSAAQSVNVSVNMIFTFAIARVFTTMSCHMKFGLFIFFAFFVVVMSLFIYKFLPETKGVPIEEMFMVWQNHSYWRKFVKPAEEHGGGQA